MLAVDTETRSLLYKEGVGSVFMIQWADAHRSYVCTERTTGWQPFLDAIAKDDMLVFANASFDIHHLRASGIVDLLNSGHRCHDVTTLARVTLPGRWSYKLEKLCDDLLGMDATEAQRSLKDAAKAHGIPWTQQNKDFHALWRAEPALMERYGREDVRLTFDLWALLWGRASQDDISVYRMEIAGVAPLLRAAERDGVLVDQARLAVLRDRLERERDELRERLLEHLPEEALGVEAVDEDTGEIDTGSASNKALLAGLLDAGVPLYRNTPKGGQLAVNKDALVEFKTRFPVVGDLMEWRGRKQLLKTYVAALETADPRIHTSFNQAQARTSRMSASRPNVQNLPTPDKEREDGTYDIGVRHVLVPAPGNAFVVADFDSIEVRVLAYFLADADLIRQLDDGLDMHQRTAWKVALKKDARARFEDFVKGGDRGKERDVAKITTFTSMYGGGARLLSTRLGITVEEAAAVKAEVLGAIPGYWDLDDRVKRAVRSRAFPHIRTILGRRLYVPKDKPYVALNTLIQGTAAELMKLGMVAAAPPLAALGYAIRLIVHDELVAEGPADLAPEALAATINAMESCHQLSPRLKVTGSFSTDSYGKAK